MDNLLSTLMSPYIYIIAVIVSLLSVFFVNLSGSSYSDVHKRTYEKVRSFKNMSLFVQFIGQNVITYKNKGNSKMDGDFKVTARDGFKDDKSKSDGFEAIIDLDKD